MGCNLSIECGMAIKIGHHTCKRNNEITADLRVPAGVNGGSEARVELGRLFRCWPRDHIVTQISLSIFELGYITFVTKTKN